MVKKAKEKFYTLDNILKKKATYNIIIGMRSNGKTYSCLKYAIDEYFKTGGQFAYIRRWREDVIGRRANGVFTALNDDGYIIDASKGKFDGICYYAGRFYFCTYDEKGKPIYNDCDLFGYTFALADNEHNKSISFNRVKTVFFDEFISKRMYLNDEFVLFMNTLSTIIRQRNDVKIFMAGNTINKYAPYFEEMGLTHVPKMEQGTIDLYTYGDSELTVAVEYCAEISRKNSNKYFAFNNPKLHMITSGKWELDFYPHLFQKYKPENILFIYFIIFNNEIYQAEIIKIDDYYFTYIHIKTSPLKDLENDLIYDVAEFNPKLNHSQSIFKPINKLQQKILWFFVNNRVCYQNNSVGNAISNCLLQMKSV